MRIVDRKTFLQLPVGTVFQKFEPDVLGEICIKGKSISEIDFYVTNLQNVSFTGVSGSQGYSQAFDQLVAGEQRHVEFTQGRDGCYDGTQFFAIWEEFDLRDLRERLDGSDGRTLKRTNFDKAKDLHALFDRPKVGWDALRQLHIDVEHDLQLLRAAIQGRNLDATRKYLADILVSLHCGAVGAGLDTDADFDAMYRAMIDHRELVLDPIPSSTESALDEDEQMRQIVSRADPMMIPGMGTLFPLMESFTDLPPSLQRCRITFHRQAKGAKPVTVTLDYEGFVDVASRPHELVNAFFKGAMRVLDTLIFIDAIVLSDGRAMTMRWTDPNDILQGITWTDVSHAEEG